MARSSLDIFHEGSTVAIQGYDQSRRVFYWNDASESLYGYRHGEALGEQLEDLIIPHETRESVITEVDAWMSGDLPPTGGLLTLRRRDGSRVRVHSHHLIVRDSGTGPRMFCIDVPPARYERVEAAVRHVAGGVGQTPEQELIRGIIASLTHEPHIPPSDIAVVASALSPEAKAAPDRVPNEIATASVTGHAAERVISQTRSLMSPRWPDGSLVPMPRRVSIQDLLVEVGSLMRRPLSLARPQIVMEPVPAGLRVRVDPFLARQAILALTRHALASVHEIETITLAARLHHGIADMVFICVEDTGPPLPPEVRAAVLIGHGVKAADQAGITGPKTFHLAIAQRIAMATGALLSLDRTQDGRNISILSAPMASATG